MVRIDLTGLGADPIAAAAHFHAHWMPRIAEASAGAGDGTPIVLVFPAADHTHGGWRLAAVQMLARDAAPARINAVSVNAGGAIDAALRYLNEAEGVTGQYLVLDDAGAGAVLDCTP